MFRSRLVAGARVNYPFWVLASNVDTLFFPCRKKTQPHFVNGSCTLFILCLLFRFFFLLSLEVATFPLHMSLLVTMVTRDIFSLLYFSSWFVSILMISAFTSPSVLINKSMGEKGINNFILIYSFKRLLVTWLIDMTPSRAELLRDNTEVSQLSNNELSGSKAWSSSSNIIFMEASWFMVFSVSFRYLVKKPPSLSFKLTSFLTKKALLLARRERGGGEAIGS